MRRFGMLEYSCLLWAINVILNVLSYFVAGMTDTAPFLFLAAFVSFVVMSITAHKEQVDMAAMWRRSAKWADIIAFASFAYFAVNFMVCMFLLREGGPHIDNGVYCLWNHGFVREITKEEYDALVLVEGGFFTGHMLPFLHFLLCSFLPEKTVLHNNLFAYIEDFGFGVIASRKNGVPAKL